jgi:hypothetical protein
VGHHIFAVDTLAMLEDHSVRNQKKALVNGVLPKVLRMEPLENKETHQMQKSSEKTTTVEGKE